MQRGSSSAFPRGDVGKLPEGGSRSKMMMMNSCVVGARPGGKGEGGTPKNVPGLLECGMERKGRERVSFCNRFTSPYHFTGPTPHSPFVQLTI